MGENCCANNNCTCSCGADSIKTTSASLSFKDSFGSFKTRIGINRMNYKVDPGLYAVGNPASGSPVLVSANYKLSFDTLRKNLSGLDLWILVIDTKGINVWCAAGEGTFGTNELVSRIEKTGLSDVVSHKRLILPQLGASGVSAHEVRRMTGFSVVYGPVRASDIKEFIAADFTATQEMRTVNFTLKDRLVLTPIEITIAFKASIFVFGVLFLLNLFMAKPFDVYDFAIYTGAVLTGSLLVPLLLPFIPGRAFSFKGWLLGLLWTLFALWLFGWFTPANLPVIVGYLLLLPSLTAYIALNFTGCSTYTSPSGVVKEMVLALPPLIAAAVIGAGMLIFNHLIG
jgi:hypothetical protein